MLDGKCMLGRSRTFWHNTQCPEVRGRECLFGDSGDERDASWGRVSKSLHGGVAIVPAASVQGATR